MRSSCKRGFGGLGICQVTIRSTGIKPISRRLYLSGIFTMLCTRFQIIERSIDWEKFNIFLTFFMNFCQREKAVLPPEVRLTKKPLLFIVVAKLERKKLQVCRKKMKVKITVITASLLMMDFIATYARRMKTCLKYSS